MADMADMDIEMDLDLDLADEYAVQEIITDFDLAQPETAKPILSTPNDTSIPDSLQPAPEKVHIRGLDNLTTADIKAFAAEHFEVHQPVRVEWIDDTSANIVYDSSEIALQALIALVAIESSEISKKEPLHLIPTKQFAAHSASNLQVRLAVRGDKKTAGARDRSRFYLWNPEHDPGERRRREGHRGNRYRERDDDGYRSQRYDEREHQKRGEGDLNLGLDASMYDDDESALAKRAERNRPRDRPSRSDSRPRNRARGRGVQELFPDREGEEGRLRGRSASPVRENEWETRKDDLELLDRKRDMAAVANREKAQLIKAKLRKSEDSKELFPNKFGSPTRHRRSDAFDAADETADLFSSRMAVPFVDDNGEPRSLASRVTNRNSSTNGSSGFSIRGTATQTSTFTIKGAAGNVKELFPATFGENSGKELFSERIDSKNRRRQKAGDLFD